VDIRGEIEIMKTSSNDTDEQAFQERLKAEARREEVEALAAMRGMDLADEEVMAGAWRRGRHERGSV
jgi:hypothetical protein